ncbi:MAG: four helix bundle protein [Deltaproteobacteria bacterium]|nr:four helix bundle protein [Deltaproteobacteria bacterium]
MVFFGTMNRKPFIFNKWFKGSRFSGLQDAAGYSMPNIAEGFDSETNGEFMRFLRYAKRSCTTDQRERAFQP